MSIRISQGGRLFGIMAGLGGAVMSGSAGSPWTVAVFVSSDYLRSDVRELNGADRLAMLVLGLFVVAGAACFIALGSRRMRMTAGTVVVLAAAAGLVIALLADSPSFSDFELSCTNAARPTCLQSMSGGSGRLVAGFGAVLAAGYGIVALLRSGGEAHKTHATERPAAVPSGANSSSDFGTPPKRRMSDASLLAWTVVAIVIALVVGAFVVVSVVCSEPVEC
jgi:hypothetical protein